MAKVLVTGASGFVGRYLVPRLCQLGHDVRCYVRSMARTKHLVPLQVEFQLGTLDDIAALRRAIADMEYVYHLAALTSAPRFAQLLEVNGRGTMNVTRVCGEQSNPPVLLYCSSIAASGPIARGQVRHELDPARPISYYGHSKRAGELVAEDNAHRVPTTIVRPGIVFGPWGRQLLPVFRSLHWIRIHAIPGFRSPKLSFIHAADLVELMISAAEQWRRLPAHNGGAPTGEGYYFASAPEYPDYAQFGRIVRPVLRRPHAWLLHFPEPFPWLIAAVYEVVRHWFGLPDSFNIDKVREIMADGWACSPAAAQRDLGFEVSAPLSIQLQQTARWYRENQWL